MQANDHALDIHKKSTVVAMHTDFIGDVAERRTLGQRNVLKERHLPTARQGGISAVCDHVVGDTFECLSFPTSELLHSLKYDEESEIVNLYGITQTDHGLHLMDFMLSDIEESEGWITVCKSVEEINSAKKENKLTLILCFQGVTPIKDDLSLLRNFYRLGIREMGLVVRKTNLVSDTTQSKTNHGLTEFGFNLVEEANRLGICLDVSHLSPKGFSDVISQSKYPVVASNSSTRGICDDPRNLNDDQIHSIAENGGVIGIHVLSRFVSPNPNPSIRDVVDHVEYITKLVGIDHVGIGPDIVSDSMYPREAYERIWNQKEIWQGKYPTGLTQLSEMPNFTLELVQRGYSDDEISKVLGENVIRVFRKVWK